MALAAAVVAPWNFILIRSSSDVLGRRLCPIDFGVLWCLPQAVGNANATAAGWRILGSGVALVFMVAVPFNRFKTAGRSPDMAWLMAMFVPAALLDVKAVCLKLFCWDTPTARRLTVQATGKRTLPSMWDCVEVLKGFRIFRYSACFGTGLP